MHVQADICSFKTCFCVDSFLGGRDVLLISKPAKAFNHKKKDPNKGNQPWIKANTLPDEQLPWCQQSVLAECYSPECRVEEPGTVALKITPFACKNPTDWLPMDGSSQIK